MAVSRDLYELGQLRDLRVTSPLRHGPLQTLAERCFSEASTLQRSVIVQTAVTGRCGCEQGTETWQLCAYNEAWLEDLLRCSTSPLGVASDLCIAR